MTRFFFTAAFLFWQSTDLAMITDETKARLRTGYSASLPFPHAVIDNFFTREAFDSLAGIRPEAGYRYQNQQEQKTALSDWFAMPPAAYAAFNFLCSPAFANLMQPFGPVEADAGLWGAGIHYHGPGDFLETHIDHAIHPRTGLTRELNLVIYLSDVMGGDLVLESKPGALDNYIGVIEPRPNRAAIFRSAGMGWHGVERIVAGERVSLATYFYSTAQPERHNTRAFFTGTEADEAYRRDRAGLPEGERL